MRSESYIKPKSYIVEVAPGKLLAASGTDTYKNEKGTGETYSRERRSEDWGELWER